MRRGPGAKPLVVAKAAKSELRKKGLASLLRFEYLPTLSVPEDGFFDIQVAREASLEEWPSGLRQRS